MASAPSIFQRVIENLLQGISGVCVYIDDILITGTTEVEHLDNGPAEITVSGNESEEAEMWFPSPNSVLPGTRY